MIVSSTLYFYPRSPCGERLKEVEKLSRVTVISIHALLAESDRIRPYQRHFPPYISIHALLAESDLTLIYSGFMPYDFYPRSPCGERPWHRFTQRRDFKISIHALLAESDSYTRKNHLNKHLFLSTLSLRRATRNCQV